MNPPKGVIVHHGEAPTMDNIVERMTPQQRADLAAKLDFSVYRSYALRAPFLVPGKGAAR
jgi:hypothetical protein